MNYKLDYENAIANRGNWHRLKALMRRADAGEKLVIGFIGGSITQGSVASDEKLCYAYHVFSWWKRRFPGSGFEYRNAGIGGTTSHFGAARVDEDLLEHRPDFVIVEFSVNDESNEHFMETYEGLVRKIYASEWKPAVVLVNNVFYHNGANAQIYHAKVGRHYRIPCVSMQSTIYPEVVRGRIDNRQITPDDLHPNDTGHALVASVIEYFLDQVYEERDVAEEEAGYAGPVTANTYESAVRIRNDDEEVICRGFIRDETPQLGITDCFKNGWTAIEEGASIEYEFEGSGIAVQFRRSVAKPAPVARAVVDGEEDHAVILDANFDEDWGDLLALAVVTEHAPYAAHRIRITITEAKACAVPFYLASLIVAR